MHWELLWNEDYILYIPWGIAKFISFIIFKSLKPKLIVQQKEAQIENSLI